MTLSKLAAELNLSIATVSRGLTRPEFVAPETRKRILKAAERFNYCPNAIARSLRTQQTKTIGVIVSDIRNPFCASLVRGIEDVARANRFTVLVCNADEDLNCEEVALQLFLERQAAGVIHCSAGAKLKWLRLLQERSLPVVDLDRASGLKQVDTVMLDNELASTLAVEHLAGLRHTRIAMVAGPDHLSNARSRLNGFRKAMAKARIKVREEYIVYGNFREESGRAATAQLLALPIPPTAIFVANNEMTAGAISLLKDRKISIPEEISLVGFDDSRWARYMNPPLTVVTQPTEAMGKQAAEFLFLRLRKQPRTQRAVFTPSLVVRDSTGPPVKPGKSNA